MLHVRGNPLKLCPYISLGEASKPRSEIQGQPPALVPHAQNMVTRASQCIQCPNREEERNKDVSKPHSMGDMGVEPMFIALPSHRCEDIIIVAVFFPRYVSHIGSLDSNRLKLVRMSLVESYLPMEEGFSSNSWRTSL